MVPASIDKVERSLLTGIMLNGHALLQSRLQWLAAARTRIPTIVNFSENG